MSINNDNNICYRCGYEKIRICYSCLDYQRKIAELEGMIDVLKKEIKKHDPSFKLITEVDRLWEKIKNRCGLNE